MEVKLKMEVTIKGTTKEIADLIMELQSQRIDSGKTIGELNDIYNRIVTNVNESRKSLPINP